MSRLSKHTVMGLNNYDVLDGGAHSRHLENRIELSVRGRNVAFCQITLSTSTYPFIVSWN